MWLILALVGCLVNEDLYAQRLALVRDDDGDGVAEADGDCDDQDAARHPGAPESCDGEDDDCDGAIDEDPQDRIWYLDGDNDGHAGEGGAVYACEAPGSHWMLSADDCDDNAAGVFPGHSERCDGVDEDCDGTVDEDPVDPTTYYVDTDGDGFGDPSTAVQACLSPGDRYVTQPLDCDDTRADTHPGAPEQCDEVDNDCDGHVDDPPVTGTGSYFPDDDGDGYGDPTSTATRCEAGDGFVDNGDDCDDRDPLVNPDAIEVCLDGVDNDCDGSVGACDWPAVVDLGDYYSIFGTEENGYTGQDALLADLNADGVSEVIVGSPYAVNGGSKLGAIDFFRGSLTSDQPRSAASLTIWGDEPLMSLGDALSACDVDGDSYLDLLLGGPTAKSGSLYTGRSWVVPGPIRSGGSLAVLATTTLVSDVEYSIGAQARCAGNLTGGTREAVVLGNFHAALGHIGDGVMYVLDGVDPGTVSVPDAAVATMAGDDDTIYFGVSSAIIDADADGFNDLLVGVPGAPLEGAAALFLGPVNGYYNYDEGDVTIWGEVEYGLAGEGVHNLGDANDDGVDDMLITDPQARNGAAYVVWGGGTLPTTLADADLTFRNSDSSRIFGSFSSALGDLNGDGAVDFYIAESGDRPCANHLFFGPFDTAGVYAETDHAVLLRTTGDSECYVETALNIGDQSGDGANDLLIGSPLHTVGSTSAAGIAYIIPGYGW